MACDLRSQENLTPPDTAFVQLPARRCFRPRRLGTAPMVLSHLTSLNASHPLTKGSPMFGFGLLMVFAAVLFVFAAFALSFFTVIQRGPQPALAGGEFMLRSPHALPGSAPRSRGEDEPVVCGDHSHQMVGVTAPEVLTIARRVSQMPARERNHIHERSRRNAVRARGMKQDEYERAGITCPLASDTGACAVWSQRPVQCHQWCSTCESNGESCQVTSEGPVNVTQIMADHADRGVSDGLSEAGLDGTVYELNSALARALETPDAGRRWVTGDDVFSGCGQYLS